MNRSLARLPLCAVVIDGTIFKGQHLVVAIGIDTLGHKLVLGLIQGATENATVVSGLLDHLAARELDLLSRVCTCWTAAKRYGLPSLVTPAMRLSFSVARSIRSAISSNTCRRQIITGSSTSSDWPTRKVMPAMHGRRSTGCTMS